MNGFILNGETEYFQNRGVDITAFGDIYPEGHQSGVSIIMHGNRVAANGDVRFEQTPGQWQPVPKLNGREVNRELNSVAVSMSYPDEARHLGGFNPMIYPDFKFDYKITAEGKGESVIVTVDLNKPVPEKFAGKICFNLELFPGILFGKYWIMDNKQGVFPIQPNGPLLSQEPNYLNAGDFNNNSLKADIKRLAGDNKKYNPIIADDIIAEPYATGKRLTICPDDLYNKFTVEAAIEGTQLKLYDGRLNHNNGWFVINCEIPAGRTENAVKLIITPNIIEDWVYTPVVQTSQVGYHPEQTKTAVIELDKRENKRENVTLYKITESGEEQVLLSDAENCEWGRFLRYNYLKFDFTDIKDEGLYKIKYGAFESSVFRIAGDIYERGVWQPVLEYFLPVQMCHMRVNEKYRVWHDLCHGDDAVMAPLNFIHIDGYVQGESTLTKYKPGESVPGLNSGGWHDAGDFDLRVESQSGEVYILSLAYEEFNIYYDATSIDQDSKITEIHQPDGKNDILQQIEHGVLSIVGAYNSLGRLYRGIIENSLRQYVHLGDSGSVTDGIKGNSDDRWVFTENNPARELNTAAHLAAASRALKDFNNQLSVRSLEIAEEIFDITNIPDISDNLKNQKNSRWVKNSKIHAAAELFLATKKDKYRDFLISESEYISESIDSLGWIAARAEKIICDEKFSKAIYNSLTELKKRFEEQRAETPYGVPYRPHIWGAGWNIQRLGFQYYFLHKAYPEIFSPEMIFDSLNFVLGCHPGSNNISFASGVGVKSAVVGYGLNRADWSYIPGGVISGTALIRPDLPELLEFPYLWQQTEYVMGGGSSHYMFLVLAVRDILNGGENI
ncbi:MAG: glycoside hydrolase family 9 protein [Oscillospiraceae bacterium]|nr:glycoside hydrolase family 9 protein [Oscillospiraceae bacterium]